ncbi:MAG TPA: hypothetical protein VFI22_01865 [Thermomicrobiales bacterium]|nr:hypothetical protein [Thermomicrobiales bacterium]
MDDNRFDAATRFLARADSRRGAVRQLAGSGLAASLAWLQRQPTSARKHRRQPCENNLDCGRKKVCIVVAGGKLNCVSAKCKSNEKLCKNADFHACCPKGTACCAGSESASCCADGTTCDPRGLCVT